MFGNKKGVAEVAQEAKDMAVAVTRDHLNHVAVCLENQHRIEGQFAGVNARLDRQDAAAEAFRQSQIQRLDQIRNDDLARYNTIMKIAVTTLVSIILTGAAVGTQVILHFWK